MLFVREPPLTVTSWTFQTVGCTSEQCESYGWAEQFHPCQVVAGCDETILICKSGRSIVRVALIPQECCLGGVGCPQEHLPLEGMPSRVSPTCQQSVSLSHLNERSQSQGLYPPLSASGDKSIPGRERDH